MEETATPFFISPSFQAATTLEKSADLHTCAIEKTPQIKEDSFSINQINKEQTPLKKMTQRSMDLYPGIVRVSQRSMSFEKPCDLEASLKEIQQFSASYLKWTALYNFAKIETQKFEKPFQHVHPCNLLDLEIAAQPTEKQRFMPPHPKSPTSSQIKLTANALRFTKFLVK
ncbi:MAG: hypothetical protein ACRDDW_06455 [Candidatus Rhabdochlamydia sp.]